MIRVCGEDIPISVSVELEKNSVPVVPFIVEVAGRIVAERRAA